MIIKVLELRDRNTFIPIVAINTAPANEGQRYLLRRAGYAKDGSTVIVCDLNQCRAQNDPYSWPSGTRTFQVAHQFIEQHFDRLADGDVVCVESILGERAAPKRSEREEEPA